MILVHAALCILVLDVLQLLCESNHVVGSLLHRRLHVVARALQIRLQLVRVHLCCLAAAHERLAVAHHLRLEPFEARLQRFLLCFEVLAAGVFLVHHLHLQPQLTEAVEDRVFGVFVLRVLPCAPIRPRRRSV